ncbi:MULTISPECIES: VOC family protein [Streptacidiphilus]|uniref:VOC family protein n=1 Tax=Streptacidiphilus cavernicola TaxID=3342716 RepID=A0ABV6V0Y8_9ACTN|nr:VOC family protein [Streptacidiphilus jeojiense]
MSLHTLRHIALGVPDPTPVAEFYTEFGLHPLGQGRFATLDGGEQLRLVTRPTRRLVAMTIGADNQDDLGRVASSLHAQGFTAERQEASVSAVEPVTGVTVRVEIAAPIKQSDDGPLVEPNAPGRPLRVNARAEALSRTAPVTPRKLGHVVVGSTDLATSMRFFIDGIGFKVSDSIKDRGSFLRCSTDHHNLLVQNTPATFVHHSSWQVEDVDEVGRGAAAMLEADPARHVWGLGRHHVGSNFFWYLRDPSGTFAEYYSDLDVIVDDDLWKPEVFSGRNALYHWGPPPPPSFIRPDDLAELMTGAHQPRG